jgi:asparagine synthase (glutamine-hydrolysing)
VCGIVGIVRTTADPYDERRVLTAVDRLRHRGPDASAVRTFEAPGLVAVLGHTRLRIVDLSPEADQPMPNEDDTVWVTYNGELYDAPERRRELEGAGHRFRSSTDTEVLVHGYERDADDPVAMLRRLWGMFAFAVVDTARSRVLLARDRFGIKPMYWCEVPGGIAFASEERALDALGVLDERLDPRAIGHVLLWGHTRGGASLSPSVRELPPGHALTWERGALQVRRWWEPSPQPDAAVGEEAERLLRATLDDAVRRHLVADRPVGVFLSGGVDSGAVATLAARTGEVRTFTVTFPDDGDDEGAVAASVARRLGISNEQVAVNGGDVATAIDDVFASMDRPTADGVNSWLVCRAARDAGLVVALSGLGGDELFGGYPTFSMVPRLARVAPVLAAAGADVRDRTSASAGARAPGGRWTRVFGATPGFAGAYAAVRGQFSPAELVAAGVSLPLDGGVSGDDPMATPGDRVMLLEFANYLPEQLLRDADQMSMAHSLEVRVPLLDDVVSRVALALPADVRLRAGKRLLADAAGVMAPQKRPFALPFDRWLRGPLRETAQDGLLSDSLPFAEQIPAAFRRRLWDAFEAGTTHWSRPWTVVVLRRWAAQRGVDLG